MSRIEIHRARYQGIRDNAYNNTVKKITYKDVKQYAEDATEDIAKMQRTGVFENLEEIDFYRDKFVSLQNAMKVASKEKMSMKEFTTQTQDMFKERNYAPRNSYLNQAATDPKITSEPAVQSRVLQSFFEEKKSKIVPDMGFRSLLENPPVTNKSFKKRVGENKDEIDRLRRENEELRRQLESGNFGSSNLEFEIRKQEERIRYLETENERMQKDNTRLRSEKSVTVVSSQPTYDDYLYSPYVLNPRENDLFKIVSRTSEIDNTTSYYNQNFSEGGNFKSGDAFYYNGESPSFNNKVSTNRNYAFSEFGDGKRDEEYSVFDMSRSHLSEYGGLQDSFRLQGGLGVDDGKTASRNKVAFFKNEGVIIRNQEIEIAYKRSENGDLSMNRVILYLNNKSGKQKQVHINYKYEQEYFNVSISEKLNNIEPFKQGREVVEVRLNREKQDINSLMEAEINVNEVSYKIWMPLMFIKFTNARDSNQYSASTRIVNPSRIFSNEYESKKLIPSLTTTNKGEAVIWGKSAVHEGPIKLYWGSKDRLEITTSEKWIDIISFLVFDYQ